MPSTVCVKLPSDFFDRVPPSDRGPYLIGAVQNESFRLLESRTRFMPLDNAAPGEDVERPRSVQEILGRRRRRRVVGELVDGLAEGQREAVRLRFWEDLSRPEAAEELGIELRALEKRVTRAYARLRKELKTRGIEASGDVSTFLDGGGRAVVWLPV